MKKNYTLGIASPIMQALVLVCLQTVFEVQEVVALPTFFLFKVNLKTQDEADLLDETIYQLQQNSVVFYVDRY